MVSDGWILRCPPYGMSYVSPQGHHGNSVYSSVSPFELMFLHFFLSLCKCLCISI